MQVVQWIVAAGTAVFVAIVGYFQWRTAQQKAALDLFDRRHEIYVTVRQSVSQIVSQSQGFDQTREIAFLSAKERAYFFFGDDITDYLEKLWRAILDVRTLDTELRAELSSADRRVAIDSRRVAFNVVEEFYKVGQPLFGRYMRFDQKVR